MKSLKEMLKKISEDRIGIKLNENTWIGGYRIEAVPVQGDDKKLSAYIQYRGFTNLTNALRRNKIDFYIIYSSMKEGENIYLLTKGENPEKLRKNLIITESTIKAIYPYYDLYPLEGREIQKIYMWEKRERRRYENIPIIFITRTEQRQFDKPKHLFKLPVIIDNPIHAIKLGRIIDNDEDYIIDISQIKRHLSCLGSTGMGKTTSIGTILNQLPPHIKYLVIDFHNEYHRILTNYDLIIRPGKDKIVLNPLKGWRVLTDDENISMISDIFSEIFGFTHPQAYYFKMILETTFHNYKLAGESYPNLNALIKILKNYPITSGSENETRAALLRRIKLLTEGQAYKIFQGEGEIDIKDILNRNVIIEVGHIREVIIRKIYAYFLLKMIYEYQLSSGEKGFNHITVMEEAKYLLPPRRDYDPQNIAERMINELRKFGESVFMVTQFPSQISKDILKNSGMLIIHRLSGIEDIRIITNIVSLNSDQIEYMKQMQVGEAIVKDPYNPLPYPVKIIPTLGKT